jgi:putative transposase
MMPKPVKMCRWLGVSASGFYNWLSRPLSATAVRRQALTTRVRRFFPKSDGTYGYRRIHAELADEGTVCSPELVRQIMRDENLIPCQPRPFRTTTEADADAAAKTPDLMKRDFTVDRPRTKFVGDITYIHIWQGFVYLATVIDCYSKKVIGWAIDDHMRSEPVGDRPAQRRRDERDRARRDLDATKNPPPGGISSATSKGSTTAAGAIPHR